MKLSFLLKIFKAIVLINAIMISMNINAQENKPEFGIKSGVNLSRYFSDNPYDYSLKAGFYAGGFLNLSIGEIFRFQPEVLFALQGTSIKFDDVRIPFSTNTYDAKYSINEFSLSLPLLIRIYTSKGFFLESGPHLDFILNRTLTAKSVLLDGTADGFFSEQYDNFDFGSSIGFGFHINSKLIINFRSFISWIFRDNDVKLFTLNCGFEYRI